MGLLVTVVTLQVVLAVECWRGLLLLDQGRVESRIERTARVQKDLELKVLMDHLQEDQQVQATRVEEIQTRLGNLTRRLTTPPPAGNR